MPKPFPVAATLIEWFKMRYVCNLKTGCWDWIGAKCNKTGYGGFWDGKRTTGPHRWSYEYYTGPIPDGYEIDHLCRNPSCCNFKHLEAVTPRVNKQRGTGFTGRNFRATHCPQGHPYDLINTWYHPKNGGRQCRECQRIKSRRDGKIKHAKRAAHKKAVGIYIPRTGERTHCWCGHEFTPENTRITRNGKHRVCKTCEWAWTKIQKIKRAIKSGRRSFVALPASTLWIINASAERKPHASRGYIHARHRRMQVQ